MSIIFAKLSYKNRNNDSYLSKKALTKGKGFSKM